MTAFRNCAFRAAIAALALGASVPSQAGITFNFTFTAGTSVVAQNAFIAAGAAWQNIFSDNVTLDLTVGTAALNPGVLGQAGSRRGAVSFNNFKLAHALDAKSASDLTAGANFAGGSSFDMLLNRTANSPNGAGSALPFLDADGDANNTTINMTTANAKALGFGVGAGTVGGCTVTCDAFIQFNSNFNFDYDPTDGITAGFYDFVGVAMHEIGHAMGFISGVDILDINSPPINGPFNDSQFTFVSPLDLFRYSALSAAQGVIDWTADGRAKYFSIDGGATVGPQFSTGRNFGDGNQASHWKDNLGIGILDPTAASGERLSISAWDTLAFDVIGWDLARQQAVPEPASWAMMIAGFAFVGGSMRRRRQVPSHA
jgi:hypothetical protein